MSSAINTSPFPLLELPPDLQLVILSHLPFWDTYALRLTCRHFASITPSLGEGVGEPLSYQPQAAFNNLYRKTQWEGGDLIALCEDFNQSWLAKKSNVAFMYCCTDDCDHCGSCSDYTTSPFPLLALPPELQRCVIDHLPFYTVAALRLTGRHLAAITKPIGRLRDEFETLYKQTLAVGTNIDEMCSDFNESWYAISKGVAYNIDGILEDGWFTCPCDREATDGYAEGCEECGWGESKYAKYYSWVSRY